MVFCKIQNVRTVDGNHHLVHTSRLECGFKRDIFLLMQWDIEFVYWLVRLLLFLILMRSQARGRMVVPMPHHKVQRHSGPCTGRASNSRDHSN